MELRTIQMGKAILVTGIMLILLSAFGVSFMDKVDQFRLGIGLVFISSLLGN